MSPPPFQTAGDHIASTALVEKHNLKSGANDTQEGRERHAVLQASHSLLYGYDPEYIGEIWNKDTPTKDSSHVISVQPPAEP